MLVVLAAIKKLASYAFRISRINSINSDFKNGKTQKAERLIDTIVKEEGDKLFLFYSNNKNKMSTLTRKAFKKRVDIFFND